MCHKYRGGAGRDEVNNCFHEDAGISRWSALRECPPRSQAPPPQSRGYTMHIDQHIDLRPCIERYIGRELQGMNWKMSQ